MSQLSDKILQRVAQFITTHHLLEAPSDALSDAHSSVYVGLSGGPDSVALLHILHRLGYTCQALHCNFHLRGSESDRDEAFCRELCRTLGVELEVKHFDTRAYMQSHHLSLEMAARQLRYDWWATFLTPHSSFLTPHSSLKIALGHHLDDSIETMLMNLMRGTGIQGLTGITPINDQTHVVRPLLCLSRQDIEQYLLDNNLSYIIDSTNAECDTLRNQIRNQLLPLMEQMVPQVRKGIVNTMQHLQGTSFFADAHLSAYDSLTEQHSAWGIEWHELSLLRLRDHLSEQWIEDYLHYWQQRFCNTLTHRVIRNASLIYTLPLDDGCFDSHKPQLSVSEIGLSDNHEAAKGSGSSLCHTTTASSLQQCFDADAIHLPLTLRRWREGDRIAPLGMNGHTKLVSDLFTNAHYSPMQKSTTWLVTDAMGAIIWVIGLRISELHKVTEATTQVLLLHASE